MLYMVVERFVNGDPRPVYARLAQRGRMAPDGLEYRGSWVTSDLTSCYQLMACNDRSLLDAWIGYWADIVDFEVIEVLTSAEAADAVAREH